MSDILDQVNKEVEAHANIEKRPLTKCGLVPPPCCGELFEPAYRTERVISWFPWWTKGVPTEYCRKCGHHKDCGDDCHEGPHHKTFGDLNKEYGELVWKWIHVRF